jgi:hypothetical protein
MKEEKMKLTAMLTVERNNRIKHFLYNFLLHAGGFFYSNIQSNTGFDELPIIDFISLRKPGDTVGQPSL